MASREEILTLLGLGFVLGGLFMASLSSLSGGLARSGSDPVVLFNDTSAYNQSIAFYSPAMNKGIVCSTSRKDEVQISRSAYKYVDTTDCRVVKEDLVNSWDDPDVRNFNVYERGQELLENESTS